MFFIMFLKAWNLSGYMLLYFKCLANVIPKRVDTIKRDISTIIIEVFVWNRIRPLKVVQYMRVKKQM